MDAPRVKSAHLFVTREDLVAAGRYVLHSSFLGDKSGDQRSPARTSETYYKSHESDASTSSKKGMGLNGSDSAVMAAAIALASAPGRNRLPKPLKDKLFGLYGFESVMVMDSSGSLSEEKHTQGKERERLYELLGIQLNKVEGYQAEKIFNARSGALLELSGRPGSGSSEDTDSSDLNLSGPYKSSNGSSSERAAGATLTNFSYYWHGRGGVRAREKGTVPGRTVAAATSSSGSSHGKQMATAAAAAAASGSFDAPLTRYRRLRSVSATPAGSATPPALVTMPSPRSSRASRRMYRGVVQEVIELSDSDDEEEEEDGIEIAGLAAASAGEHGVVGSSSKSASSAASSSIGKQKEKRKSMAPPPAHPVLLSEAQQALQLAEPTALAGVPREPILAEPSIDSQAGRWISADSIKPFAARAIPDSRWYHRKDAAPDVPTTLVHRTKGIMKVIEFRYVQETSEEVRRSHALSACGFNAVVQPWTWSRPYIELEHTDPLEDHEVDASAAKAASSSAASAKRSVSAGGSRGGMSRRMRHRRTSAATEYYPTATVAEATPGRSRLARGLSLAPHLRQTHEYHYAGGVPNMYLSVGFIRKAEAVISLCDEVMEEHASVGAAGSDLESDTVSPATDFFASLAVAQIGSIASMDPSNIVLHKQGRAFQSLGIIREKSVLGRLMTAVLDLQQPKPKAGSATTESRQVVYLGNRDITTGDRVLWKFPAQQYAPSIELIPNTLERLKEDSWLWDSSVDFGLWYASLMEFPASLRRRTALVTTLWNRTRQARDQEDVTRHRSAARARSARERRNRRLEQQYREAQRAAQSGDAQYNFHRVNGRNVPVTGNGGKASAIHKWNRGVRAAKASRWDQPFKGISRKVGSPSRRKNTGTAAKSAKSMLEVVGKAFRYGGQTFSGRSGAGVRQSSIALRYRQISGAGSLPYLTQYAVSQQSAARASMGHSSSGPEWGADPTSNGRTQTAPNGEGTFGGGNRRNQGSRGAKKAGGRKGSKSRRSDAKQSAGWGGANTGRMPAQLQAAAIRARMPGGPGRRKLKRPVDAPSESFEVGSAEDRLTDAAIPLPKASDPISKGRAAAEAPAVRHLQSSNSLLGLGKPKIIGRKRVQQPMDVSDDEGGDYDTTQESLSLSDQEDVPVKSDGGPQQAMVDDENTSGNLNRPVAGKSRPAAGSVAASGDSRDRATGGSKLLPGDFELLESVKQAATESSQFKAGRTIHPAVYHPRAAEASRKLRGAKRTARSSMAATRASYTNSRSTAVPAAPSSSATNAAGGVPVEEGTSSNDEISPVRAYSIGLLANSGGKVGCKHPGRPALRNRMVKRTFYKVDSVRRFIEMAEKRHHVDLAALGRQALREGLRFDPTEAMATAHSKKVLRAEESDDEKVPSRLDILKVFGSMVGYVDPRHYPGVFERRTLPLALVDRMLLPTGHPMKVSVDDVLTTLGSEFNPFSRQFVFLPFQDQSHFSMAIICNAAMALPSQEEADTEVRRLQKVIHGGPEEILADETMDSPVKSKAADDSDGSEDVVAVPNVPKPASLASKAGRGRCVSEHLRSARRAIHYRAQKDAEELLRELPPPTVPQSKKRASSSEATGVDDASGSSPRSVFDSIQDATDAAIRAARGSTATAGSMPEGPLRNAVVRMSAIYHELRYLATTNAWGSTILELRKYFRLDTSVLFSECPSQFEGFGIEEEETGGKGAAGPSSGELASSAAAPPTAAPSAAMDAPAGLRDDPPAIDFADHKSRVIAVQSVLFARLQASASASLQRKLKLYEENAYELLGSVIGAKFMAGVGFKSGEDCRLNLLSCMGASYKSVVRFRSAMTRVSDGLRRYAESCELDVSLPRHPHESIWYDGGGAGLSTGSGSTRESSSGAAAPQSDAGSASLLPSFDVTTNVDVLQSRLKEAAKAHANWRLKGLAAAVVSKRKALLAQAEAKRSGAIVCFALDHVCNEGMEQVHWLLYKLRAAKDCLCDLKIRVANGLNAINAKMPAIGTQLYSAHYHAPAAAYSSAESSAASDGPCESSKRGRSRSRSRSGEGSRSLRVSSPALRAGSKRMRPETSGGAGTGTEAGPEPTLGSGKPAAAEVDPGEGAKHGKRGKKKRRRKEGKGRKGRKGSPRKADASDQASTATSRIAGSSDAGMVEPMRAIESTKTSVSKSEEPESDDDTGFGDAADGTAPLQSAVLSLKEVCDHLMRLRPVLRGIDILVEQLDLLESATEGTGKILTKSIASRKRQREQLVYHEAMLHDFADTLLRPRRGPGRSGGLRASSKSARMGSSDDEVEKGLTSGSDPRADHGLDSDDDPTDGNAMTDEYFMNLCSRSPQLERERQNAKLDPAACIILLDSIKGHHNSRKYAYQIRKYCQLMYEHTYAPAKYRESAESARLQGLAKNDGRVPQYFLQESSRLPNYRLPEAPQQPNSCDCGVFTVQFCRQWLLRALGPHVTKAMTASKFQDFLFLGRDMFEQSTIPALREQIARSATELAMDKMARVDRVEARRQQILAYRQEAGLPGGSAELVESSEDSSDDGDSTPAHVSSPGSDSNDSSDSELPEVVVQAYAAGSSDLASAQTVALKYRIKEERTVEGARRVPQVASDAAWQHGGSESRGGDSGSDAELVSHVQAAGRTIAKAMGLDSMGTASVGLADYIDRIGVSAALASGSGAYDFVDRPAKATSGLVLPGASPSTKLSYIVSADQNGLLDGDDPLVESDSGE